MTVPLISTAQDIGIAAPPSPIAKWKSRGNSVRLYCDESVRVMASLPENSIDCIWTDPPYLLSNGGVTCIGGKMVSVNKGKWDRSRGPKLDHEFNTSWLKECMRLLKPSGTIWVSGTLHVYPSIAFAMQELGFRLLNDIIWEKPAPPPNLGCRCFTHSTELLLWATKPSQRGSRYTFQYEAMKRENGGKQMKNVWRGIAPPGRDEKVHGKHPTQKPVELVARCLRASTNPGDIVLDPFAGSGTTGVAAARMGRSFVGIDASAEFLAVAEKRLRATRHEAGDLSSHSETQSPLRLF